MKDKTTVEKQLETMQVPTLQVSAYKSQLEDALMNSSHWNKKTRFIDFLWKGGENIMQKNTFISLGVVLSVITVVVVATIGLLPKDTKTAYAEQIAQNSSQAVSQLSPSQLQALKQRLPLDPNELLQEAKSAKDLQTLTYDQLVSAYPQFKNKVRISAQPQGQEQMRVAVSGSVPAPKIGVPDGVPDNFDMKDLTFLQFTDTNGDTIVLGIDKNNLPVFTFGQGKDGSMLFGAFRVPGSANISNKMYGDAQKLSGASGGLIKLSSVLSSDGKTITINGKKYAVPAGATPQSAVQVDYNGTVSINGVQVTPEQ